MLGDLAAPRELAFIQQGLHFFVLLGKQAAVGGAGQSLLRQHLVEPFADFGDRGSDFAGAGVIPPAVDKSLQRTQGQRRAAV